VGELSEDEFLLKMKREIDENILRKMDDEEFERFISKLSLDFGREIKRRKLKAKP
jgi:hypothetical protein